MDPFHWTMISAWIKKNKKQKTRFVFNVLDHNYVLNFRMNSKEKSFNSLSKVRLLLIFYHFI